MRLHCGSSRTAGVISRKGKLRTQSPVMVGSLAAGLYHHPPMAEGASLESGSRTVNGTEFPDGFRSTTRRFSALVRGHERAPGERPSSPRHHAGQPARLPEVVGTYGRRDVRPAALSVRKFPFLESS